MNHYYRWLLHSVFIQGRTTLWCYRMMIESDNSNDATIDAESVREDLDLALRQLEIDFPAANEM